MGAATHPCTPSPGTAGKQVFNGSIQGDDARLQRALRELGRRPGIIWHDRTAAACLQHAWQVALTERPREHGVRSAILCEMCGLSWAQVRAAVSLVGPGGAGGAKGTPTG
jgi:hypothetical protein